MEDKTVLFKDDKNDSAVSASEGSNPWYLQSLLDSGIALSEAKNELAIAMGKESSNMFFSKCPLWRFLPFKSVL